MRRTGRAVSRRKSIPAQFEKTDPCSGIMPQVRRTGRAVSRRKSIPAQFEKTDPCSGIMPLARRTGRAASRRKSIPARFEKTDPCSGIMPLARRTGRAASREDKTSLLDFVIWQKEAALSIPLAGSKNHLPFGIRSIKYFSSRIILLSEPFDLQFELQMDIFFHNFCSLRMPKL